MAPKNDLEKNIKFWDGENRAHQEKDVEDWKAFEDVGEAWLEVDWLMVEHKNTGHVSWNNIFDCLKLCLKFIFLEHKNAGHISWN